MIKNAASEFWDTKGKEVIQETATTVGNDLKQKWNENKTEIIADARKAATDAIDKKLNDAREKVIKSLTDSGVDRNDIDANHDGTITDEEIDAYTKSHPVDTVKKVGIGLAIWYGLWQLRKRTAPPPTASPPPTPGTGTATIQ